MKFTDLQTGVLYAHTTALSPRAYDWSAALIIEKGGWKQIAAYGLPRPAGAGTKDSLILKRYSNAKDTAPVEEAAAYPVEAARRWLEVVRQRGTFHPEPTEAEMVDEPPKGWTLKVAKPQHLRMTWEEHLVQVERNRQVQEQQAAERKVREAALEAQRRARLAALADLGIEERWGLVDSSGDVRLRGAEFDSLLARLRNEVQA